MSSLQRSGVETGAPGRAFLGEKRHPTPQASAGSPCMRPLLDADSAAHDGLDIGAAEVLAFK